MTRAATIVAVVLSVSGARTADTLTLDPKAMVVFPASQARELLHQCSRSVPQKVEGTWAPTDKQISWIEAQLPDALSKTAASRFIKLGVEIRQYGGLLVDGRQVIYLNAFPHWLLEQEDEEESFTHKPSIDWKHKVVTVCDGGSVFFGATVDPVTGTFDFDFDGVG